MKQGRPDTTLNVHLGEPRILIGAETTYLVLVSFNNYCCDICHSSDSFKMANDEIVCDTVEPDWIATEMLMLPSKSSRNKNDCDLIIAVT